MDARRADAGYVRLYADVYQLHPATGRQLKPKPRPRGHLRLVVTEPNGSRRAPR